MTDIDEVDFPTWISQNGWEFDTEEGDWVNMELRTFADNFTLYNKYIEWMQLTNNK